jgi:hypothetical protein
MQQIVELDDSNDDSSEEGDFLDASDVELLNGVDEDASGPSTNNNPTGKNQFQNCRMFLWCIIVSVTE